MKTSVNLQNLYKPYGTIEVLHSLSSAGEGKGPECSPEERSVRSASTVTQTCIQPPPSPHTHTHTLSLYGYFLMGEARYGITVTGVSSRVVDGCVGIPLCDQGLSSTGAD